MSKRNTGKAFAQHRVKKELNAYLIPYLYRIKEKAHKIKDEAKSNESVDDFIKRGGAINTIKELPPLDLSSNIFWPSPKNR